jgi:hypothetical protein
MLKSSLIRGSLATLALISLVSAGPADAGKKKEAAPAPAPSGPKVDAPADDASQKFVAKLLATPIKGFRPGDAGGAEFRYDSLTFAADNTFQAAAFVEMDGERMDCTESGSWKMDPAESEKAAVVEWTIVKTNCAGRESGGGLRVRFTIDKDGVNSEFR